MEFVQKALDSFPEYPRFLYAKGLGFFKQERNEEAINVLNKAEDKIIMYNHRTHQLIEQIEKAIADQKVNTN